MDKSLRDLYEKQESTVRKEVLFATDHAIRRAGNKVADPLSLYASPKPKLERNRSPTRKAASKHVAVSDSHFSAAISDETIEYYINQNRLL